jgi:hypothetical protein
MSVTTMADTPGRRWDASAATNSRPVRFRATLRKFRTEAIAPGWGVIPSALFAKKGEPAQESINKSIRSRPNIPADGLV